MAVLAGLAAHVRPQAAGAGDATYRLEVDGRVFTLSFTGGGFALAPAAAIAPELAVTVSASTLLRLRLGAESVSDAMGAGRLRFSPEEPALVGSFLDRFALAQGEPA
jgi:hypothetical protein